MTAPDREEYSLAPNLQQIVDASKTAPQWDTVNDRLAAPVTPDPDETTAEEQVGILTARVESLLAENALLRRQFAMGGTMQPDPAAIREAALREAASVILPADDLVWAGSWYEPALRAARSRILTLIQKEPTDDR